MRASLRAFAAALAFLTRIPTAGLAHDLSDLSRATPYFPIVGLIVGGWAALVFWLGALIWPPVLAVIISIAATVLLTGAFHEDALADSLDGFGGGWKVEQVLAIMKDSRVGSYALVGLTLVLVAKIVALTEIALPTDSAGAMLGATMRAMIAAHVLGRWSSVPLIRYHEYVRLASADERPGVVRPFVDSVGVVHFAVATLAAVVIVGIALGVQSLVAWGVCIVVTWFASRYFRRRIGGITGDALGAANQLVELSVYLALAAHIRR